MQAVDNEIETIHLYVVRQQERRPYTVFPLFCAFLCLMGIVGIVWYSAEHPYYEHERLRVPAQFLPLTVFTAEALIIPTGTKTYPATYAVGMLTLTNGSVLSEGLPSGLIFSANNGAEVQTTATVFVPAGSASGYGEATVPARAVRSGKTGNIPTLAVDAVYGTALYVRNLSPFTGGTNAYSVTVQLPKDRQTAVNTARAFVTAQQARIHAFLVKPCNETILTVQTHIRLSWACQFATYKVPSYMRVSAVRLAGKNFLVDVVFVLHPVLVRMK